MADFKPLSLAQMFEPPENFAGHFGWLCGYSADAGFLNNAAERFTACTSRQRAYLGRIYLCLVLDRGNPQISPTDVPGVLHLPLPLQRSEPFNLLHAKVALLGFRSQTQPDDWRLRLIVSTGNWTRETLEASLDLAWTVEIASAELAASDDAKQALSDIRAAWRLLYWLRQYADQRVLTERSLRGQDQSADFESWIQLIIALDGLPEPRFIDNQQDSLLEQLPQKVRSVAGATSRNYLAIGSGFYEAPSGGHGVPRVIDRVVNALQEKGGVLTKYPEVDIFVNPLACQAVAEGAAAIRARDYWTVRAPGLPAYFGGADRALHAKFLFSCNCRDRSNVCSSSWIYLGSGNLTQAGFIQKASRQGGNLEAGVVLDVQRILWEAERDSDPSSVITNLLPVQWNDDVDNAGIILTAGDGMPERESLFVPAPVALLHWTADNGAQTGGWLSAGTEPVTIEVLDPDGAACSREEQGRFRWLGEQPRQVKVRWQTEEGCQLTAVVPVLDELGRLAATKLPELALEEAWIQLASFPLPPADDELPDDRPDNHRGEQSATDGAAAVGSGMYPVREMMTLIENIADRQITIDQSNWTAWCNRLEQILIQAASDAVVEKFRRLQINPISALWHEPFRPEFAESDATPEGTRYQEVLRKVEEAWEVTTLAPIAEMA